MVEKINKMRYNKYIYRNLAVLPAGSTESMKGRRFQKTEERRNRLKR